MSVCLSVFLLSVCLSVYLIIFIQYHLSNIKQG